MVGARRAVRDGLRREPLRLAAARHGRAAGRPADRRLRGELRGRPGRVRMGRDRGRAARRRDDVRGPRRSVGRVRPGGDRVRRLRRAGQPEVGQLPDRQPRATAADGVRGPLDAQPPARAPGDDRRGHRTRRDAGRLLVRGRARTDAAAGGREHDRRRGGVRQTAAVRRSGRPVRPGGRRGVPDRLAGRAQGRRGRPDLPRSPAGGRLRAPRPPSGSATPRAGRRSRGSRSTTRRRPRCCCRPARRATGPASRRRRS